MLWLFFFCEKYDSIVMEQEEILIGEYDLDELATKRLEWGLFRDRRPEMYRIIAGQK